MQQKNKDYYKTLDSLRFGSFLLVFLTHCGIPTSSFLFPFSKTGGAAVGFFFCLSGFLITGILLKQKERGSVNLKGFYLKRSLRIVPLFYAMLLLALFTPFLMGLLKISGSDVGYEPNWWISFLFLENYKMMASGMAANVSPLGVMWSLCIEIHFYLLWGILFRFLPLRYLEKSMWTLLFISYAAKTFFYIRQVQNLELFSNLDLFVWGSLIAFSFSNSNDSMFKKILSQIPFLLLSICVLGSVLFISNFEPLFFRYFDSLFLAPLFALLIASACNRRGEKEKPVMEFLNAGLAKLGTYTYGLYLFHTLCLLFVSKVVGIYFPQMEWGLKAFIALLMSLVVSVFSFHLFELKWMRMGADR